MLGKIWPLSSEKVKDLVEIVALQSVDQRTRPDKDRVSRLRTELAYYGTEVIVQDGVCP